MRPSVVIAMMLALAFGGASAQGPDTQPAPDAAAAEASLHAYGDSNKTCREWTDGCRVCRRPETGEPNCSNIGIACQPKAITCAARLDPPK